MEFALLFLCATIISPAKATMGVDVSYPPRDWGCLRSQGVEFAIARVGRSTGSPDPNARTMVSGAKNAGIKYVDGYIFPCYKCGGGKAQVEAAVRALTLDRDESERKEGMEGMAYREERLNSTSGAMIGQLWLDIEGTQYWSSSHSSNIAFIRDMTEGCNSVGITCAFYTSESQWAPITGGTTEFSGYQLWYAHYDGNPSFSDFKPFGGWSKPAIKQYRGDATMCGSGVDVNFY
mmetsp:Transcript_7847/g.19220  ORF Transcript_7847/g.19220 Transcript_7847/m.19220 type:complete len:234 (-) Transcript_7847:257-958(-)|eukprot:CAMPEP_0114493810 /NCGR_PEP_ID=MMETSP0109-20121206/4309_1 /TAXON_ID=29199 /ORGANISM="Chlorarachnion reptans, Strain CCCM449" /LENGTH=233 /DNA_ID=CAMNT_0001670789 /DNA_START=1538 /DNA_END=2239 /DNA_ORIENTATION=+